MTVKWSCCIVRLAGADIRVHVTVPLYALWSAITDKGSAAAPLLDGSPFFLLLVLSVLWHEIAHARAAQRVGVGTKYIYLTPIAGFAVLKKMPDSPDKERAIVWAGLQATLSLAVLGFVGSLLLMLMYTHETFLSLLLLTLSGINAMLFLFNVLPVFPLDGGKILRSLLAEFLSPVTATSAAAVAGTIGALALLSFTWHIHPVMWFLCLLLPVGAWMELETVRTCERLKGISVQSVMQTDFRTVAPGETLQQVVGYLPEHQKQFPVLEDGKVVGILTRSRLQQEMTRQRGHLAVRQVMCREVEKAQSTDCMSEIYLALEASDAEAMVVLQDEQLIGLISRERVQELLETTARDSPEDARRE
ncbi:MAG: site-2 protease family protein [bacterium]|nr:site-2 protease family protein [bacterium]